MPEQMGSVGGRVTSYDTERERGRHEEGVASPEGKGDRRERRDDEVQLAAAAVLYTQGEAGEADNLQRPIVVSPRSLAQEVQFDFGLSIMLVRATSNIELSRPLMVLFSEENTS